MKKQSGMSMVELMITLAIAGMLLAFAVPNMRDFLLRQKLNTRASDMLVDFVFARAESINRGIPVRISAEGSWFKGWKVITDTNKDGILNGSDEIVRVSNQVDDTIVFTDSLTQSTHVFFNGTGSLNAAASRVIVIKHPDVTHAKTLTVSLSGSTSVRN